MLDSHVMDNHISKKVLGSHYCLYEICHLTTLLRLLSGPIWNARSFYPYYSMVETIFS